MQRKQTLASLMREFDREEAAYQSFLRVLDKLTDLEALK